MHNLLPRFILEQYAHGERDAEGSQTGLCWPNMPIRLPSEQSPKGVSDFESLIIERM